MHYSLVIKEKIRIFVVSKSIVSTNTKTTIYSIFYSFILLFFKSYD